jgi:hypothetical protein
MPELADIQTREMNRAGKLTSYLNMTTPVNIGSIWATYVPFSSEVTLYTGYVAGINLLVPVKELSGHGITETKDELKANFAFAVDALFSVTRAYARTFNNDTIFESVNMSETEILKLKDTEILGFANGLNGIYTTALLANTDFTPYGITATKVSDAIAIGVAFNGKIGGSKSVTIISNEANDQVNGFITKMRISISNMLDLGGHFKTSHPEFVTGLEAASRRDDIGVKHTGAHIFMSVGGVATDKGSASIGAKTVHPNGLGECPPIYLRHGDKTVTAQVPGMPPKSVLHHFIRGQMDDIVFDF